MPVIKSNVHTHTNFCDGENSMEEMARAAAEKGFTTLGFSFHSYTPFDKSYCIRDYYAYMQEFSRVKKLYAGKTELLNGVELDLYGQRPSLCDYVIGSVHYLKEGKRYFPIDFFKELFGDIVSKVYKGDAMAAVKRYYAEVCELVTAVNPDIYGPLDLITRYNSGGVFFDENGALYKKYASDAVAALPQGALVEINFGRLFKGEGGLYPSDWLLSALCERGCRFILSSDAHCTRALGYGFDEALPRLKALGIKSLCYYNGLNLTQTEI